ncbi:ATP synthase F1 subunit delta [Pendulispora rubella]|uniref:ATP synthase subunit delta n=1 Tax=Pendulispora rubella TaxID=2741070 RepID=A0ABZ2KZX3_9BACT
MVNTNVARRYAAAILEIGRESGNLGALVEEIVFFAQNYQASAELRSALENPLVSYEAKRAILGDIADQLGLGQTARNTLLLLNDRRRMRVLPDIAQQLKEKTDLERGVVRASVTTAVRLSEGYYAKLQAELEKMTGKRVVLDRREDPSIIAGVIARIGDTVIDGSIRTQLQEMKHALLPDASGSAPSPA